MTGKARSESHVAGAGLPSAAPGIDDTLRSKGIDPDRLSVLQLGLHYNLVFIPPWLRRLLLGVALVLVQLLINRFLFEIPRYYQGAVELATGLLILQAACEALVSATERLAARFKWNHYVAGTLAEILATTPELVVIAFVIPISPLAALIISIITIYNNALVFSLYSFFLPKDKQGKFLMPAPITEAGTQVLIAGAAMGLVLGLVMMTFNASEGAKNTFEPLDLVFISVVLLIIFGVYIYRLITGYAEEEAEVRENLSMSAEDISQRIDLVYQNVKPSSFPAIAGLFLIGMAGALLGGGQVSSFAETMIADLAINPVLTAMLLAIFAGMSEYVILWQSHHKGEFGIALANAFGGITQVMFLVLPFTLLGIAFYQVVVNPAHAELPLTFSLSTVFLFLFLFPTFYTLSSLLEEDHTLGILDTTIMTLIFLFLIVLLVTYGAVVL